MANNSFGDFQTPVALAEQCLKTLGLVAGARVLEPTCGRGAFLEAATMLAPSLECFGLEINANHVKHAARWGRVIQGDIFQTGLQNIMWETGGPLFVVGNPPWVTSADLKRMGSKNHPTKENTKRVKGIDALLGSSNFDISEAVIMKILRELSYQPFTLGMLCKTQVVRNVVEYCASTAHPISGATIHRIDAKRWFNASVDACWFTAKIGGNSMPDYVVEVFENVFDPSIGPSSRFGMVRQRFVSDVDGYLSVRAGDGVSPYVWRSGLKHDAAKVFELKTPHPDLEPEYVFPLLKSTDIYRGKYAEPSRRVVVPQLKFGEDTKHLRVTAPKLWAYLESNAAAIDGRKSSIYVGKPRFSVFGLGEYTFAPYKVAISGLHKEPVFRLVPPFDGQPVIVDDTCYMLPFNDPTEAATVTSVLNSTECSTLIDSLAFWDSKRPITKKLLSRLNLNTIPVNAESVIHAAQVLTEDLNIPFDRAVAVGLVGNFSRR